MRSASNNKQGKAGSRAREKEQGTVGLSKKLSLALEQAANEGKTTIPGFEVRDQDPLHAVQEQRKSSVLEKAKALVLLIFCLLWDLMMVDRSKGQRL